MTLFNDTSNDTPAQIEQEKDYLSELVGEDKKFKDASALARGKAEADLFIERLKREQQELRDELNQRARLAELVDKLGTASPPQQEPQRQPDNPNGNERKTEDFDPSKLPEIIQNLLNDRENKSLAQRNVDEVKKTLVAKYGDSYSEKLKAEAARLGVSPEWVTKVAEQSPKAFYNLIGLNPSSSGPDYTPPKSENRSNFAPSNPNRDQAYYEKLRKTNPTEYWKGNTQNQMHKDAIAQGEKFFS